MIDPLFGCDWDVPCKTLDEAKELFEQDTKDSEIIHIRGHPKNLDGTSRSVVENISLWKNWIDWIYQEHNLININHTQAIQYNVDRYSFKVEKNSANNYTIDLSDCLYDHDVLFTQPYENSKANWELYDSDGDYIGKMYNDTFFNLEGGKTYFFSTVEELNIDVPPVNDTPAFEIISLIISLFVVVLIFASRKTDKK